MPRDKDMKRVVRKRMATSGERYTEARAAIRPRTAPSGAPAGPSQHAASSGELVEFEIPPHGGIRINLATGQHFVVLKERDGERILSICIGMAEANAIAVELAAWPLPRPLTSDLMVSSIRALGGEVARVVITRVDDAGTFYAEVQVHRDGMALPPLDARPSDALGVAVRTAAPVFVAAEVMSASGGAEDALAGAVAAMGVTVRAASGTGVRSTVYTPMVEPTHVVVDTSHKRVVALLRYPEAESEQPAVGTLLTLPSAAGERAYRVESVEPTGDGLIRLKVAPNEDDAGLERPGRA